MQLAVGSIAEDVTGDKTETAVGLIVITKGGESETVTGSKTAMVGGAILDLLNADHVIEGGGPTTLMEIGVKPEPRGGDGAPDPQTPINAARPEAAAQTPRDPTGAVSQAVEKAEDGLTTKEKREEKVAETAGRDGTFDAGKKD